MITVVKKQLNVLFFQILIDKTEKDGYYGVIVASKSGKRVLRILNNVYILNGE